MSTKVDMPVSLSKPIAHVVIFHGRITADIRIAILFNQLQSHVILPVICEMVLIC